jgi:uncharacterized protein (DUF1800 family)
MGRDNTTFRTRRATRRLPADAACLVSLALFFVLAAAPAGLMAGEMTPEQKISHIVNRLTFGPAPGDLDRVRGMGVEAFVREQLEPDAIPPNKELAAHLEALSTTRLGAVDLFREYGPTPDKTGDMGVNQVLAARDRAGVVAREAFAARMWRAVADPAQLRELLVEFWYNHFNVDAGKGLARIWAGAFEREAIRPYALGRFLDLLAATAMHPAMLISQENWRNTAPRDAAAPATDAPDTPAAPAKESGDKAAPAAPGIDATYARTLLAVHTLGDATAFSDEDVQALARVFTGWRIGAPRSETDKNGFFFDQAAHDPTDKAFLSAAIPGGGMAEGAAALRLLAGHPATAGHVCRRLAAFFLAADPPPGLVERLAKVFLNSGGEIRAVLAALFSDPEFFDEKYVQAGYKSPLRQVASAVRATGRMPDDPAPLAGVLARMGTPLYYCPDPAGYAVAPAGPPTARDLAARVTFAADLTSGRLPLWTKRPEGLAAAALSAALGRAASTPATAKAAGKKAAKSAPSEAAHGEKAGIEAAAVLAGPDFLRY